MYENQISFLRLKFCFVIKKFKTLYIKTPTYVIRFALIVLLIVTNHILLNFIGLQGLLPGPSGLHGAGDNFGKFIIMQSL